MRSIFATAAIAAAAASLAVPAFAKAEDVQSNNDQVVLKAAPDGRFCTPAKTITGSILPQKICKTRAEWIAAGATVNQH